MNNKTKHHNQKWPLRGKKRNCTIRLSEFEKQLIYEKYESLQDFVQQALEIVIKQKEEV